MIGHPDLEQQVSEVFAADPKRGPVAVAMIRALLESFDEDPMDLEPAPVNQVSADAMTVNVQRDPKVKSSAETAHVVIYVFEVWGLRFGIARVQLRSREVLGAWLMVEPLAAAAKGIATRNLSQALLSKVEELIWSI